MPLISSAKVYLIPVPIAEGAWHSIPPQNLAIIERLRHYIAENARTARRMLRQASSTLVLEDLEISEIDKHSGPDEKCFRHWLTENYEIGIMSEAGCPAIADPGSRLVLLAHQAGAKVIPLTGPSSLLLALMASGLNGQSFAFEGYLPVKEPHRSQRLRQLEEYSRREKQTKIFIETPYRNNQMLADLLKHAHPATLLCVALYIGSAEETIVTDTIANWKKKNVSLPKAPAVFLILG